jgi:hypothetical protein
MGVLGNFVRSSNRLADADPVREQDAHSRPVLGVEGIALEKGIQSRLVRYAGPTGSDDRLRLRRMEPLCVRSDDSPRGVVRAEDLDFVPRLQSGLLTMRACGEL